MTAARLSAERAYAQAVERLTGAGGNQWVDRAVYWTAVRFGVGAIQPGTWPAAAERWTRLWEVACQEHLPPIPGVPDVGQQRTTATVAEHNIAQLRALVGRRKGR